jgi:hypothetical protein
MFKLCLSGLVFCVFSYCYFGWRGIYKCKCDVVRFVLAKCDLFVLYVKKNASK